MKVKNVIFGRHPILEALNEGKEFDKIMVLKTASSPEISEITGLTASQVKVYIYRGRKFLQKYIGNIEVLI